MLTGGNVPPTSSRYAPSAGPTGPTGASGAGVPARKQQPAQARRRAVRQPVPKSQNSGGILSIGQGYEASASSAGGQPAFQQGSVGSLPRSPAMVAPDTSVDFARLIATHAAIQTQAHGAAVDGRIVALESQVSQLTSTLRDVRMKARQGYDRLKLRIDILERLVLRDPRQAWSPPRSPSPLPSGGYWSDGSYSPSPSPPRHRGSSHGRRRDRAR